MVVAGSAVVDVVVAAAVVVVVVVVVVATATSVQLTQMLVSALPSAELSNAVLNLRFPVEVR